MRKFESVAHVSERISPVSVNSCVERLGRVMEKETEVAEGKEVVHLSIEGGQAVITVCRPEVRNALNFETMFALKECVKTLQNTPSVRAVVLCGEGAKSFISGGDLKAMSQLQGERGGHLLSEVMGEVLWSWERLPQVTIAAIQGDAFGGGVEVALACDMRVLGARSRLGLTQGKFGVTTGWGGAHRLVRHVGYARALEWLLSMEVLDAERCLAAGLVSVVVPEDEVVEEAMRRARMIGDLDAKFVRGVKEVVFAGATLSPDESLWVERQNFAKLWSSPEHVRKVDAFLKRDRKS